MAHYFDMAWISVALVLVGALAAAVPAARRRALWLTGGLTLIGAARTAFTGEVTWSLLAVALGLARHGGCPAGPARPVSSPRCACRRTPPPPPRTPNGGAAARRRPRRPPGWPSRRRWLRPRCWRRRSASSRCCGVDGWTSAGGGSLPVDVVVGDDATPRRRARRCSAAGRAAGSAGCSWPSAPPPRPPWERRPSRCWPVATDAHGAGRGAPAELAWVPGFLPLVTLLPAAVTPTAGRSGGAGGGRSRPRRPVLATAAGAAAPGGLRGPDPDHQPSPRPRLATVLFPLGGVLCARVGPRGAREPVVRLRRSTGLARRQVVVLLVAVAGAVAVSLVTWQLLPPAPAPPCQAAAVGLLPVAVGSAITRPRLYELDLAVCRALVLASLGACLAGVYLTVFALLTRPAAGGGAGAVRGRGRRHRTARAPAGRPAPRGVDRLFYGERADPYAFLSAVASSLRSRPDLREVPRPSAPRRSARCGCPPPRCAGPGADATGPHGQPAGRRAASTLRHRGGRSAASP